MRVSMVNLFKPQTTSALREKYANNLYPIKSQRVSVVNNVDPLFYTQICRMEKELDKAAKIHDSEFVFMQHKDSDAVLMNFKTHTSVLGLFDLNDAISIALDKALRR